MRSIFKSALAALVAVCAVSAVGVASASAAECPGTVEGGGIALCSGGHEQKGSFAFTGVQKAGTSYDVFRDEFNNQTIRCASSIKLSKGTFTATTGKLEVSGLDIEYGKCQDGTDEADCEVTSITVDGGEGKGTGPGLSANLTSTAQVTLTGGGTGQKWTEFRIRSKEGHTCAGNFEWKVKGTATCSLPESTVEAVTHILKCEELKSELRNFGIKVGFELTAELKLSSGKAWSLQKI
jgi:hypothetical protein